MEIVNPTHTPPDVLEQRVRRLASAIDLALSRGVQEQPGFALFVLNQGPGGWLSYASNIEHESMMRAFAEWMEKEGGGVHDDACPHSQPCDCVDRSPS